MGHCPGTTCRTYAMHAVDLDSSRHTRLHGVRIRTRHAKAEHFSYNSTEL